MTKPKHQVRVTVKSAGEIYESPEGRLFFDDKLAKFTDLSGVRLLRCGVDTVRQLYNGMIRLEVMALFDEPEDIVEFAGYQWVKGRVGRDSGYQYRLQNADTGLILLIKNHNVKLENIGPYLKIEVSPHALDGADPAILRSCKGCSMTWLVPCSLTAKRTSVLCISHWTYRAGRRPRTS